MENGEPEGGPPQDTQAQTTKFSLGEAMMNKKHLTKVRDEVKRMKTMMAEMQVYVQEHQVKIAQDLVGEDKLKVTFELLEGQMHDRIQRTTQVLEDKLKLKIKKRMKYHEIDEKLKGKVGMIEFMKQIERIDNGVQVFTDSVEYKLPAIQHDLERQIKHKADKDQIQKQLDTKVDHEYMEKLLERINKIEEMAAAKIAMANAREKTEGASDEESDEDADDAASGEASPDSPKKKNKKKEKEVDSEEERMREQKARENEEAMNQMKETVEKLQTTIGEVEERIQKQIDDDKFQLKRFEKKIEDIEKQQKAAQQIQAAAASQEGAGSGKINQQQQNINMTVNKRLEDIDREIERLQKLDHRMRKELVQQPYIYADRIKAELEKEQQEIVKIVKNNNDKYVTKIAHMDHKVSKILTDTETLLDQYRRKIGEIGKNLEKTQKFREEITVKVGSFSKRLDKISDCCDNNHIAQSQLIERISLKFAETTVDAQAANEGFQREIERINLLFRELQQEYVQQLEEKRQHNEALLRGAGIEEKDLKRAEDLARYASSKNLQTLLPKIKPTHIQSNLILSGRQEKIMNLLKGDRLSPKLNSPDSRKFFPSTANLKVTMGADLSAVNSTKFLAGSNAFITAQTPNKSRISRQGNSIDHAGVSDKGFATSVKGRKQSQNPSLPKLDYLSKQEAEKNRYKNKTSIKTSGDQGKSNATINPIDSVLSPGPSSSKLGEDFAKMHINN